MNRISFFVIDFLMGAFRSRLSLQLEIAALHVCTENLNPDVVVMKSAKDRLRSNGTDPLNWARDRRILVQ